MTLEFSPTEQKVAAIWKATLGISQIEPQQDYFELGGDSISMIDMLIQVSSEMGADLDPGALFEEPTLRGFARKIEEVTMRPGPIEESIF